jgi:hypothetical protein
MKNPMRNLINLFESSSMEGEGYWTSPEGSIFPIDGHHHEFMQGFAHLSGLTPEQQGEDINWHAEHAGWVRTIVHNFGQTVFMSSSTEMRCRNAYEALLGRHYINGPADSITIEIVSARPFQPHRKVIDDVEGWMVG